MTESRPAVGDGRTVEVGDRRLDRLRKLAWLLDNQFRVPGTNFRFGLDALIGLVPGLGDIAGSVASAAFIFEAARLGVPKTVIARMLANVGIETVVGAIPALGDLFDAAFKANAKNLRLLERHSTAPELVHRSSRRFLLGLGIGMAALVVAAATIAVVVGILVFKAIAGGRGPL